MIKATALLTAALVAFPAHTSSLANAANHGVGIRSTCVWPSADVWLEPGEDALISAEQDGCGGYGVTIDPADGTASFQPSTGNCAVFQTTTNSVGTFKVKGCAIGSVTVDIWDGLILVQSIDVHVYWRPAPQS